MGRPLEVVNATVSVDVFNKGATMAATVQRHPTIPMSKRDSLVLNGSRISLVSTSSGRTAASLRADDTKNTHPEMVAGKKRKKVKRTDSYRIATNRQSAMDDLEDEPSIVRTSQHTCVGRDPKYNTLPTRIESTSSSAASQKEKSKRKRESDRKSNGHFHRDASQRSGTLPSPDTDDDQRSTQPERKKKSAFKRVKERFLLSIRRDRNSQKDKKKKSKSPSRKHKGLGRVKPNQDGAHEGFATPNSCDKVQEHQVDSSAGLRLRGDHINGDTNTIETIPGSKSPPRAKRNDFNLLQSIRNSFRRKQAPAKYITTPSPNTERKSTQDDSRKSQSSKPSLSLVIPKPGQQHVPRPDTQERPNSHQGPVTHGTSDMHGRPTSHQGPNTHTQSDTHVRPDVHNRPGTHETGREECKEDDVITEIFDTIISYPHLRRSGSERKPGPDRSKLRLEGLKKCRPKSFDSGKPGERSSHGSNRSGASPALAAQGTSRTGYNSDLSPTVDIDGIDCIDAPSRASQSTVEDATDTAEDITEEETQRRIDDVARRLAAIGDKINADKEAESAGSSSEIEGHRVGGGQRRLSQLEQDLLRELREFGDTMELERERISVNVLPIIKSILAAQSYSGFKRIIQQEVSHTMGWEQVAWYTYLIKTTVCVADTGKDMGRVVKENAKRYFNSTIKPWIQSRPNGWESIHEETDIESDGEVD